MPPGTAHVAIQALTIDASLPSSHIPLSCIILHSSARLTCQVFLGLLGTSYRWWSLEMSNLLTILFCLPNASCNGIICSDWALGLVPHLFQFIYFFFFFTIGSEKAGTGFAWCFGLFAFMERTRWSFFLNVVIVFIFFNIRKELGPMFPLELYFSDFVSFPELIIPRSSFWKPSDNLSTWLVNFMTFFLQFGWAPSMPLSSLNRKNQILIQQWTWQTAIFSFASKSQSTPLRFRIVRYCISSISILGFST